MKRMTFIVLIASLLCGAAAWGAPPKTEPKTVYLAPDGAADGDGTEAKPKDLASLPKLDLNPGDSVVFMDGTYAVDPMIAIRTVGTPEAPITYRAQNRHKAVLDGGTPLTGWQKDGADTWSARQTVNPRILFCNGEVVENVTSRWRRDKKTTLEEGMYRVEDVEKGVWKVTLRPWAGKAPEQVLNLTGRVMGIAGAFNIVEGLVVRHGGGLVHIGGELVRVYRMPRDTVYLELSGLVNNLYGSFNILRDCIVRDAANSALTSNESRFNLVEDCVIYNAGNSQGDHGIYVSQGAENLTLRRNVWWRTSGGAIHIYSGSGIDSPRDIVCEYSIFGPDKRNRTIPIKNRKSTALYIWGGHRWAGHNRITHNIVIGPYDRAISMHRCNFNLVAHNVFLNTDGAPLQIGSGHGSVFANNIIEWSPGLPGGANQSAPAGYNNLLNTDVAALHTFTNNMLLPRDGKGKDIPPFEQHPVTAAGDPFVDRKAFDFRLKPGSEAVDAGVTIGHVTTTVQGEAPDIGALEIGQEQVSPKTFPEIPQWLLEEWPLSKRGQ